MQPQSDQAPAVTALAQLDGAPLTARYWGMFIVVGLTAVIEFVDLFIVGFLVSAIAPLWKLTFSQVAAILLAAGIGSIFGGAIGGVLADGIGRKRCIILACVLTALVSGSIGLLPDGAWIGFAILRFFVGIGQGFIAAASLPFLVEWTPVRHRTFLTSISNVFPGLGIVAASVLSAALLDSAGWRGVALLGFMPLIPVVLNMLLIEESPRWLLAKGRLAEAHAVTRTVFGLNLVDDAGSASQPRLASFRELSAHRGKAALIVISWLSFATVQYGTMTWGPILLAQTLNVTPGHAAAMFASVALASFAGVIVMSFVAIIAGRSQTIRYCFFGTGLCVLAAAFAGNGHLFGAPLFLVYVAASQFLLSGALANLNPYSAELWPASLAGRGVGLGLTASGIGKVIGPAALGLIAGSSDLVTPKATSAAIIPSFSFMAILAILAGIAFTIVRIETNRRTITLTDD